LFGSNGTYSKNDSLLTKFSESDVGCYMGSDFLGALAYADAPLPSAMRKVTRNMSKFDIFRQS